jgi:hypothetical protein
LILGLSQFCKVCFENHIFENEILFGEASKIFFSANYNTARMHIHPHLLPQAKKCFSPRSAGQRPGMK